VCAKCSLVLPGLNTAAYLLQHSPTLPAAEVYFQWFSVKSFRLAAFCRAEGECEAKSCM
jgi:hypothetical protein